MKEKALFLLLLGVGLIALGSYTIGYSIGYARGKDEWNRQIQKMGEDLMRKIAGPNATIKWEKLLTAPAHNSREGK